VQTLLEAEGHEVRQRFRAAEAIASLTIWEPSLVLLCLQMPDTDGSDLCRSIREKVLLPNTGSE